MIVINSIDDPRIELYRTLRKTPPSHINQRVFVAEGVKVTNKLLQSRLEVESILAIEEFYIQSKDKIIWKNIPEAQKYVASRKILEEIVGFKIHSGVMAIGKQPVFDTLEVLDSKIVCMNGIIDSENVGSIVRNSAAFGLSSILFDKETSSPYLRRAVRVSMGTIFNTRLHQTSDLLGSLKKLKKSGYRIIAAEIAPGAFDVNHYEFPDKCVIVFGAEGQGIYTGILEYCDDVVYIPISSAVPSINVAASSAVIFNKLANA